MIMDRILVVASNNKNKIREIKQILGDIFEPVSLSEAGFVSDPEETGSTFLENAVIKARAASEVSGKPAIADDSGLCVFALNGEPGVFSARYACEDGMNGNASDEKNNEKLVGKMRGVADRRAVFRSAVAIVWPDGRTVTAEGECPGVIIDEARGSNGFGYDPYFLVEEYGKTFAELDGSIKNRISHRAHALAALREKLEKTDKTPGNDKKHPERRQGSSMTSKQRAYLRGLASKENPILHIGKGGISDNTIKQADEALEARELIKLTCLENSDVSPLEAAEEIAGACGAEVICAIGSRAVLYRRSKKPKIELPK